VLPESAQLCRCRSNPAPNPKSSLPKQLTKKLTRLIVHLKGESRYSVDDPAALHSSYQLTANALKHEAPGLVLLGIHWNRSSNLLLSFPTNTSHSFLMEQVPLIWSCLRLGNDIRVSFDTHWSTLHLANILTRNSPSDPVYSEAEISNTLLLNEAIKMLAITCKPRWICKPENIAGPRSSIVLSFEDPNRSIAQQLLKTPFFAFRAPASVKPWLAKPASSFRSSAATAPHSSMDVS
jgi:hypothetical protein